MKKFVLKGGEETAGIYPGQLLSHPEGPLVLGLVTNGDFSPQYNGAGGNAVPTRDWTATAVPTA